MKKLLKFNMLIAMCCIFQGGLAQSWKPAMGGMHATQWSGAGHWPRILPGAGFKVFFRPDVMDRDWICGSWLDSDSTQRFASYRIGGEWQSLPFTASPGSFASDIVQYHDTMYIGGFFSNLVFDGSPDTVSYAGIIKFYQDSLWASPRNVDFIIDLAVSGDSLLICANMYFGAKDTIGTHILVTDQGKSWQDPYGGVRPENSSFGTKIGLYNGNIYITNNGGINQESGVIRWDGQQWHPGTGIYGMYSIAHDFGFYRGKLYMAGSFNRQEDPRNPGDGIVSWNGSYWENLGGGVSGAVKLTSQYDGKLYCYQQDLQFGDATIPRFAGWDGHQWCGTPTTFNAAPFNFGFVNDTLYVVYDQLPASANGQPLSYINYFDGDYVSGTDAICSTPGLGEKEQQEKLGGIDIFPNPATDEVRISVGRTSEAEEMLLSVQIFDVKGSLVKSINLESPRSSAIISTDSWEAGVYIIEVSANGNPAEYGRLVIKP